MYGSESWTIKKSEHQKIVAFELRCWRKLLRVSWMARRSSLSILKEINPNIHWKDWCWSWSSNTLATWCKEPTHWKRPWCWERLKAGGVGLAEDEMVGWHHWLSGHESEQTPGDSKGQRRLACCTPWVARSDYVIFSFIIATLKPTRKQMKLILMYLLNPIY